MILYESEIEQCTLELLRDESGYNLAYGPDLLEGLAPERVYNEVVLKGRLKAAIDKFNPDIPISAREEALKKVLRTESLTLIDNNQAFHRYLTEGVDVKFGVGEGKSRTDKVWLIDFDHPENNDFLAVNHHRKKQRQQTPGYRFVHQRSAFGGDRAQKCRR